MPGTTLKRMQNDKYMRPNDGVLINHEIGQRAISSLMRSFHVLYVYTLR